ncbi:MAG: hypothetical protein V4612_02760 [Pseudomonadota bacterium]
MTRKTIPQRRQPAPQPPQERIPLGFDSCVKSHTKRLLDPEKRICIGLIDTIYQLDLGSEATETILKNNEPEIGSREKLRRDSYHIYSQQEVEKTIEAFLKFSSSHLHSESKVVDRCKRFIDIWLESLIFAHKYWTYGIKTKPDGSPLDKQIFTLPEEQKADIVNFITSVLCNKNATDDEKSVAQKLFFTCAIVFPDIILQIDHKQFRDLFQPDLSEFIENVRGTPKNSDDRFSQNNLIWKVFSRYDVQVISALDIKSILKDAVTTIKPASLPDTDRLSRKELKALEKELEDSKPNKALKRIETFAGTPSEAEDVKEIKLVLKKLIAKNDALFLEKLTKKQALFVVKNILEIDQKPPFSDELLQNAIDKKPNLIGHTNPDFTNLLKAKILTLAADTQSTATIANLETYPLFFQTEASLSFVFREILSKEETHRPREFYFSLIDQLKIMLSNPNYLEGKTRVRSLFLEILSDVTNPASKVDKPTLLKVLFSELSEVVCVLEEKELQEIVNQTNKSLAPEIITKIEILLEELFVSSDRQKLLNNLDKITQFLSFDLNESNKQNSYFRKLYEFCAKEYLLADDLKNYLGNPNLLIFKNLRPIAIDRFFEILTSVKSKSELLSQRELMINDLLENSQLYLAFIEDFSDDQFKRFDALLSLEEKQKLSGKIKGKHEKYFQENLTAQAASLAPEKLEEPKTLEQENQDLKDRISLLEGLVEDVDSNPKFIELKKLNESLNKDLETIRKELFDVQKLKDVLAQKLGEKSSEVNVLQGKITKLQSDAKKTQEFIDRLKRSSAELEKSTAVTKLTTLESELEKTKDALKTARTQNLNNKNKQTPESNIWQNNEVERLTAEQAEIVKQIEKLQEEKGRTDLANINLFGKLESARSYVEVLAHSRYLGEIILDPTYFDYFETQIVPLIINDFNQACDPLLEGVECQTKILTGSKAYGAALVYFGIEIGTPLDKKDYDVQIAVADVELALAKIQENARSSGYNVIVNSGIDGIKNIKIERSPFTPIDITIGTQQSLSIGWQFGAQTICIDGVANKLFVNGLVPEKNCYEIFRDLAQNPQLLYSPNLEANKFFQRYFLSDTFKSLPETVFATLREKMAEDFSETYYAQTSNAESFKDFMNPKGNICPFPLIIPGDERYEKLRGLFYELKAQQLIDDLKRLRTPERPSGNPSKTAESMGSRVLPEVKEKPLEQG